MANILTPNKLTKKELKELFPEKKYTITDDVVDYLNSFITNPEYNGYGLLSTLKDNKSAMERFGASIKEYINAIRFVAFLHVEDNSVQAYIKTFSDRDFVKNVMAIVEKEGTQGVEYRGLTSAAARYRKSPLVAEILKLSSVEESLLYMGLRQGAMYVLEDKMYNSKLDRDQIAAAKAILEETRPTTENKIQLDIGVGISDPQQELLLALRQNAKEQRNRLEAGESIVDVQCLGLKKEDEESIEDTEVLDG